MPDLEISDEAIAEIRAYAGACIAYGDLVKVDPEEEIAIIARLERAEKELALVELERDELKAFIEKLPHTADRVPITPGMTVYPPCGHGKPITPHCFQPVEVDEVECWEDGCKQEEWGENDYHDTTPAKYQPEQCYSTRERALAAKPREKSTDSAQ